MGIMIWNEKGHLFQRADSRLEQRCVGLRVHSPLQKVSADVRFPDLGMEGKNARRMSGSVVGPISSRESGESNDKPRYIG